MINRKLFQKGDQEWLNLRAKFITGTELPVLFGFNPYSNPTRVYKAKTQPTNFEANVYTRMGKILEPAVMNISEDILGLPVYSFGEHKGDLIYYNDGSRFSATPDAYIGSDIDNVKALVELKSTSLEKLEAWTLSPPIHYLVQLSAQCVLLGVPDGYLTIMHPRYPDLPTTIFHSVFDLDYLRDVYVKEIARFWIHFSENSNRYFKIDKQLSEEVKQKILSRTKLIHSDVTTTSSQHASPGFIRWWE